MAMDKDALGQAIADLIVASDAPADAKQQIENLWKDISNEIITHIQNNAEVTLNVKDPGLQAMQAAVPLPQDGGAQLKAQFIGAYPSGVGEGTIE